MKVLIGLPLYSYTLPRAVSGIFSLIAHSYETIPNLRLSFSTPRKLKYEYALSKIAQEFLRGDCDYLLLTCDDIVPPKDGLKRLLERRKEAISGLYFSSFFPHMPLAYIKHTQIGVYKNFMDIFNYGLVKVDAVRSVFVLLKREVVKDIMSEAFDFFPYKESEFYIAEAIRNKGYELWVDCKVVCGHIDEDGKIVTKDDYLSVYNTYIRRLEEGGSKDERYKDY